VPGFREFWRKAAVALPSNLTIRPSSFIIGDEAPGVPELAAGTSVILASDLGRMAPALEARAEKPVSRERPGVRMDERFDWSCQAYAVNYERHSCALAASPDGRERGCRACWTMPHLRINYTLH
jgi:hypothetical protein